MASISEQLLATPLGETLSAGEASELVEAAKTRSVARGSYLFRSGEQGNALFIILDGAFDVVLGQPGRSETVVAKISGGQVVGELEVMSKMARVASLVAIEEATVLELDAARFESMLGDNRPAATKLLQKIAKTLARRLASVNQRIVEKTPQAATNTPAPAPAAAAAQDSDPEMLDDADVMPMDDDDLDVLDKLWS